MSSPARSTSRSTPTRTGGPSRSRATSSSPPSTSPSASPCRATASGSRSAWARARLDKAPVPEPIITFEKVNKWFGDDFHVLRDIDLRVTAGERIVICGPSGSGKSTLLRCINRLEEHQEGRIVVDGIELADDVKAIERVRRQVGMVFQQFNLFPHLTVLENLTLAPMWVGRTPRKEAEERAMEQLARVRIAEQARKYPLQ